MAFNVDRGWPDSRGSAIDETYVPAAGQNLEEGHIVTLGGAVGAPTISLVTLVDLTPASNSAADIADALTLVDATPCFVVVEGNVAATGNLSGSWLGKAVCLIGGGMKFTVPTAKYDLNGGAAATVFAPGSAVTVAAGLISARNAGTADRSNFQLFGWVEDYNAATGALTVIRK